MVPTLALGAAPLHAPLTLAAISTDETARRRLAELGLRVGVRLNVLQRLAAGGRIVNVAGARVALGRPLVDSLAVHEAAAG